MKRTLSAITFAILFGSTMMAEPTPVILDLTNHHGTSSEHNDIPRAPIRVPSLYIEDHTLSFSSSCVGYTLQLVQDDVVVYTYYIQDSDDLCLPSNLTGIYEIRLVGGSFTFVGEIEL